MSMMGSDLLVGFCVPPPSFCEGLEPSQKPNTGQGKAYGSKFMDSHAHPSDMVPKVRALKAWPKCGSGCYKKRPVPNFTSCSLWNRCYFQSSILHEQSDHSFEFTWISELAIFKKKFSPELLTKIPDSCDLLWQLCFWMGEIWKCSRKGKDNLQHEPMTGSGITFISDTRLDDSLRNTLSYCKYCLSLLGISIRRQKKGARLKGALHLIGFITLISNWWLELQMPLLWFLILIN